MMLVGGNKLSGIHGAHFGPGVHIRYVPDDPKRQSISSVEYQNNNTGVTTVFASDASKQQAETLPKFDMQCVDCHNRPTHTFDLPDRALDKAMAGGEISVTLPFIKREGLKLLQATYDSQAQASERIRSGIAEFYRQNHSELFKQRSADITGAANAIVAIYNRNVFPELKVTWGTYPNNLGHMDSPGCFRCHDGSHTSRDGKTITSDCSACHETLAMDEAKPDILKTLGIEERISTIQKH
jgi:hypothetical protein